MLVEIVIVNKDENYIVCEWKPEEAGSNNVGKEFLSLQREFGKCVSKVHSEVYNDKPIGWVFEKKAQYTDTKEDYIQQTWVTLHNTMPKKTVKVDYDFKFI